MLENVWKVLSIVMADTLVLPKDYLLLVLVVLASGSDVAFLASVWTRSTLLDSRSSALGSEHSATSGEPPTPTHACLPPPRCTGRTANHVLLSSLSLVHINSSGSLQKAAVSCRKVPELRANKQVLWHTPGCKQAHPVLRDGAPCGTLLGLQWRQAGQRLISSGFQLKSQI